MAGDPQQTSPPHVDEHDKFIVPQSFGFSKDRKSRSGFAPESTPQDNLPIVVPDEAEKQVDHGHWGRSPLEVESEQPKFTIDHTRGDTTGIEVAPERPEEKKGQLIFGFKKRTFWLLLALLTVIIVGGAVGGGVGGGIAVKNKNEAAASAAAAASQAADSSSSASPASPPSSTSASNILPTESSKHPGFSLRVFSNASFSGQVQTFTEPGFYQLAYVGESYIWLPKNTYCSVSFCEGDIDLGWRGYNSTYRDQFGDSIGQMSHINLACTGIYESPGCPDSPLPSARTVEVETATELIEPTGIPSSSG
ncbi:hypothetical protein P152DRAFT_151791 [Eremomyces bilateralis CBS 781.70]|uniref:Uncharacterized protein n=1 Tax=Eremomyces bilateralis CBS 781.70 TaxID=1392243 RepID=A0A6G1FW41_9PEZI|nr:uncharacterized protein P152DRAFT_151791 [Eremomyces bilateralis CBS 781.70]KAF1809839.1 hypothetical protein P152DRAFT_151791 [Eremomyces bilateralis CBS 781.70]